MSVTPGVTHANFGRLYMGIRWTDAKAIMGREPSIARYIEQRLRRPVPCDCNVVAGSTPVLSFGPAKSAQVATLGLNPSRVEFLDDDGCELTVANRRLATQASLHTTDLANAHPEVLQQILDDCN